MSLVKCPSGHVYNPVRYGKICPYCKMKLQEEEDDAEGFIAPTDLLEEEIRPVCGWLVCCQGPQLGRDYRIHSGKNFIGRSDTMDIQVLGDDGIARKNHAVIVYNYKQRNTMLLPGDSEQLVFLNDQAVYVPVEVKPFDTIELGNSRFLFVELCGKNFEWNDKK